jgi:hypothetical protein
MFWRIGDESDESTGFEPPNFRLWRLCRLLGTEDEGRWIDPDSVVIDLVVDVVSHACSVTPASEALVSCDRLVLGHCCWHGHSVRLAVEDHDTVA